MNKLALNYLVLVFILSVLPSCAGNGNKVEEGEATAYDIYNAKRPDIKPGNTGFPEGNAITAGIAGIYQKTVILEDAYKTKLENSKVAKTLEAVRKQYGEAAYRKEVRVLTGRDKTEYDLWLKNNVNLLEAAVEYSPEATSLAVGIINFDYNVFVSNPIIALNTLVALDKAKDQILYTETALEFMLESKTVYEAMLSESGR